MTAMIIDALGVRPAGTLTTVRERAGGDKFFWLDIFGGVEAAAPDVLSPLGLKETDIAWALRFGQMVRMSIGGQALRATTWMATATGALLEVHLLSTPRCILTVWNGDATALNDIREQFAERVGRLDDSPYHAAGILLQLLLGTLDNAIRDLDLRLDDIRLRFEKVAVAEDFAVLKHGLQKLQSFTANFSRFSSSVRTAIVGIETVPGMDSRGAEELNQYAEQVEDVEGQLHERRSWMSDLMHDYATAIAQRQGEQINRLTVVSLIFLPVSAFTGFFGMNFNWMIDSIGGGAAFLVLGVMLPLFGVALTIAWLMRRGLIRSRWNLLLATKSSSNAS